MRPDKICLTVASYTGQCCGVITGTDSFPCDRLLLTAAGCLGQKHVGNQFPSVLGSEWPLCTRRCCIRANMMSKLA